MAVTKVINSESKQYKPVLTDMLVLDAVPTVNSLNGVTSDAVARAIAGASGEVPQVTENDNGKVLTAVYDEGGAAVEWAEAQGGASYTAGDGIAIDSNNEISADVDGTTIGIDSSTKKIKLLSTIPTVDQSYSDVSTNAQSGAAVAEAIAGISVDEVPTVGSTDDGKVLTASYSGGQGSYSWETVQSGTTYSAGDGIAIDSNNEISADVDGTTIGIDSSTKKIKLLSTIPTVDQSYSDVSTNAQSGVAVAEALAAINQVPSSTSADEDKVLTVDSNGDAVWATAQGGGGGASYTASAPIVIESDDIKLNYNSTLSSSSDGKFTVTSTSADANNTKDIQYFNNGGCYGLYVYNTGFNLPNYAGSLAILYKKPSNYYQDMVITGAAAAGATGWTVVIYDPKAPTTNYCIANEEYEFAGVSGDDAIVFKTYSSADTNIYYKFTFSTANCHGTVYGDLLGIQIIPLPTSATSGTSCAGTTYLNMVNSGHQGNYNFAVYGTITPFSALPAANSGSFENTYTEKLGVSADAVKFDPKQFTKTTKSVIPAGAVGDTLGTYGYKGVKVNSAFYTGNPYGQDQAIHYSFKWAATGSWLYDQPDAFTTSQTLGSDVRVLFYQISDPTKYCEFTGVTGLGVNWTDYTVGIIGNYWDQYGKCYGPKGSTSTAGYWSIDFTIDTRTSRGTNTTHMDWQNIVTNTGYAICFYTPGTTGSAPNGCDYSSIPEAILAKFGNIQEAGLRKVQDKLLVPTSSTADNGKVLTVSSGNATWANPSVVPTDITTAIDAAVDVDTDNAVFTGDGDSVKMEFTRVTDTSTTHVGEVTLTSNTTENANNVVFLIFDLDSGYKTFGTDFSPQVHISDAITGIGYFYGGFSTTTTSGSIGSIATVSNQTVSAQDIDVKSKLGNNNYQRRYLLIGAYSANGPAGYDAIAAQLKASVSITGWPGDVYGTKVVIPNIPDFSSLDAGKVLQVQNDGTLAWVTLS